VVFLGSLATITIILTAFGTMLDIVRPANALKLVGVILGIVVALIFIPCFLVCVW